MPAHPIDFQIQAHVFSTPELERIFDEKARFQRWLDFEAALAYVQAEMGIIPQEAGREINAKARVELLDLTAVTRGYQEGRNSLMPLVKALRQICDNGHGEFVHYGVTTQDVLDTALVLELKETLFIVRRELRELEGILLDLAERHRDTPMVGRTHGQQALPITLGFKIAVWLAEVRRHIERMPAMSERVLLGQLSGAVGTMAALGPRAREIAVRTLARLGLGRPTIAWHTARDSMAELACFFGLVTATLAKIANEIFQLGKNECDELAELSDRKEMDSSTMPHKQNPVLCQRVVVLGRHVRALSPVIMEGMVHEHERDARSLWSEWLALPQICIYTGTALFYMNTILRQLDIRPQQMARNMTRQGEMIASEWLLFRLAGMLGKMKARDKVHALVQTARDTGQTLQKLLLDDPDVGHLLSAEDMEHLASPWRHTGHAQAIVDAVLAEIREKRSQDPS